MKSFEQSRKIVQAGAQSWPTYLGILNQTKHLISFCRVPCGDASIWIYFHNFINFRNSVKRFIVKKLCWSKNWMKQIFMEKNVRTKKELFWKLFDQTPLKLTWNILKIIFGLPLLFRTKLWNTLLRLSRNNLEPCCKYF